MKKDMRKVEELEDEITDMGLDYIALKNELEIIKDRIMELERIKETKEKRKSRYWENKEIENQRSKVWREQQKLGRMLEDKSKYTTNNSQLNLFN